MRGMVYVYQHTICRQSLGAVAGDGIAIIEVTYRLRVEGERRPYVHFQCHHPRVQLLYRAERAIGDAQLAVGAVN
jgi:hypothetical protein